MINYQIKHFGVSPHPSDIFLCGHFDENKIASSDSFLIHEANS